MSVPSVCPPSCRLGKGQVSQADGLCLVPSWSRGFVVLAPGHVGRCLGTKCAVPLHRGCTPHAAFMVVAEWAGPSHVCPLAGEGEGVCLHPGVLFGGPWSGSRDFPGCWPLHHFLQNERRVLSCSPSRVLNPQPLSPPTATSMVAFQPRVRGYSLWVSLSSLLQTVGIPGSPRFWLLFSSPPPAPLATRAAEIGEEQPTDSAFCLALKAQLSEALEELGSQKQRADMVSP